MPRSRQRARPAQPLAGPATGSHVTAPGAAPAPGRALPALATLGVALASAALLSACGGGNAAAPAAGASAPAAAASAARPALTVTVVRAQRGDWAQRLSATGSIAPWQEAVVGAESAGLRLVAVDAQVGDRVRRGQVLARLSTDTLQAEIAQTRAGVAEAEAVLLEARANADRARSLQPSGVISTQQAAQAITAEQTALARVASLKARLQADELRLAQTRITAPDDGVVSARAATLGSVVNPGQELFRLIRGERLEWRAELGAADLVRLKPGTRATLVTTAGATVEGTVRLVAPTLDAATRSGIAYVDLPRGSAARAGMFARGEFETGQSGALSLPQAAVLLRDGFAQVMVVEDGERVRALKVGTGRRQGERVEITTGLPEGARVVASGAAFLTDGDRVKVVDAPPALPAAKPAATPAAGTGR